MNARALLAFAILAISSAMPAAAQTRTVPGSVGEMQLSFAPVVERTQPALVNVYAKRVQKVYASPLFDDPVFRRFFGDQIEGMQRQRVQSSLGSGVVVRPDGYIVTNNHVIAGGEQLTIALPDRREFAAQVILADERTDLAVLKIDTKGERLAALDFANSDEVKVGDLVLALGNPFGVGQTVTSGIVSALARTQIGVTDYQFFIQTDAAINPGNSGGALVDLNGRIVGINTAIYSRTGGSNGVGFAIPANMVRLVVEQAAAGGKLVRPWLGASTQAVTQTIAESLGIARPQGVLITAVANGSPADKAGLRQGDLILKVSGFPVDDAQALRYRIATQRVGATVPVEVLRQGGNRLIDVRLTTPPEMPPRQETLLDGKQPMAGATVINLSPAVNEENGFEPMAHGVLILSIARRSPAHRFGFGPGDLVRSVNGAEIKTVDDLKAALAAAASAGGWLIQIERGGQLISLEVR